MKPEIILSAPGHAGTQATLMAEFDAHKLWEAPDQKQFIEKHKNARGLATFGPMTVDGRFIDQFPKLEIIANFGVGVDAINLDDAKKRKIIVTNTPDVLNECVADTGIALVLNTLRKFPQSEQHLRAGNWVAKGPYPLCTSLGGKTMGILGLGRIGEAVAKRAMACGMKIRYHNRNKKDAPYPYDPDPVTLAKNSDVLMVITPGGAETSKLVNAQVLDALGPQGYLVNIARGSVVDEPVLHYLCYFVDPDQDRDMGIAEKLAAVIPDRRDPTRVVHPLSEILLARILAVTRSRVAMWYSASLAVVLLAGLYEVAAAALGVKELIGAVNSVTAALASSLLAALAIAEQMRQERAARQRAEAELRGTYDALPIGLFTLDRDGSFLRVNPAAARMLGTDPAAAGLGWNDLFEPRAWHRPAEFEVQRRAPQEPEPRWFHVRAAPAEGKVEGSLQDTTERYRATERLRFLAENDALTGVLNRRGIDKLLEAELGRLPPGRSLAVGYLDLDRFKLINDLFGHAAGDEVLRQVCRRVEEMLGAGHALGRIGGDEFVLVFTATPIRSAAALCRGILEALGSLPYQSADKAFQVTGSIGLVEVAGGTPVSDAVSMADQACRAAKAARGERLMVYERGAAAFKAREQELRLAKHLGAGVAPAGLFLVMQPILSLHSPCASLDFEVLVRLREADGSILAGGAIMAAAENNGRAAVIDRWVLATTLAWLEQHRAALGNTRFACMNLSGASLNDERFVREAFSLLAAQPRAAARLCIEITESIALHDLANTRRFIDRVRGFGAKVALDDFGAGYTSFSYLKELPADALKIDGSFVRGVHAHPANLAIVEAIAELSRNLGMQSIAEWAEECATVEALREAGIDYAQGYVIARPQAPERILAAGSAAAFIEDAALRRFVGERGPGSLSAPALIKS